MIEGGGGGSSVNTGGSGSWSRYLAGILRLLGPSGSDEDEPSGGTLTVMVGLCEDEVWASGTEAVGLREAEAEHEAWVWEALAAGERESSVSEGWLC